VVGDKIRFGLAAVKNVGRGAIEAIIEVRKEEGPFKSFQDFCDRIDHRQVTKRVLESLIKCGAVDSLGSSRAQLMQALDSCVNAALKRQRDRENGQISLFDIAAASPVLTQSEASLPEVPEYPKKELLTMEKEVLGLYISGHPLREYEDVLQERISHTTAQLAELADDTPVVIGGIVAWMRKITTRKGDPMVFMVLEDLVGSIEVIIFPDLYRKARHLVRTDTAVLVRGRISSKDEEIKVIAENIAGLDERPLASLYIKVPEQEGERHFQAIQNILRLHHGNSPVCLFFENSKKMIRTREEWWVNLESGVVDELITLLGEERVYIKQ